MGEDQPDNFDLDTVTIGVPALVTALIGLWLAIVLVFYISSQPDTIDDKGDPERKKIAEKITKLGKAINSGATAFLLKEYSYLACVALCLFVLVAAAVNWRTGIW